MSSCQSTPPPSESNENIIVFESHRASEDANPDTNQGYSLSCPTDETSIYNAARTNSAIEGHPRHSEFSSTVKSSLDAREAANMAMFLSRTSDPASHLAQHGSDPGGAAQKSKDRWWQSMFWSDNHAPCSTDSEKDEEEVSLPDESSRTTLRQHLKATSLDDTVSTARMSKWPGDFGSPVSPAQPKYPPPVRPATPPGLPSFGTPEAMCFATQYAVRSAPSHRQTQRGDPPSANRRRRRAASYGEWLRRLFGSAAAVQTRPNLQLSRLARAEDGTIVQGRFPYRNSGHGTHMGGRGLESHPFHRGTLPVAECSLINGAVDSGAQNTSLTRDGHGARQRGGILLDWRNQYLNREAGVDSPAPKGALAALLRHVAATTGPASRPSVRTTCPPLSHYHSCSSQPITAQPRASRAVLGYTIDPPTSCSLITTRSPPDQHADTTIWHHSKQLINTYLCCSCGSAPEQETLFYPSNETYMTAHGCISNVSSVENAHGNANVGNDTVRAGGGVGGRWWGLGDAWRSFRGFAARNVLVVDGVIA
ncbi:uncharacterized protein BDW47DRAFT_133822 [Aspergillus candidus]|uniref:Uncharacterized protein n=1 Tax=Aspergillus candidus TaxID=41067 RepID=A0A2I2F3A9_ASPCN|nr:hypothetical protein BDW47DRAFT_133822 [Aspergillus candidus]PLB35133.1 hypothetical protein BDW47DRAFT_133822 [Aspergillus candidus]